MENNILINLDEELDRISGCYYEWPNKVSKEVSIPADSKNLFESERIEGIETDKRNSQKTNVSESVYKTIPELTNFSQNTGESNLINKSIPQEINEMIEEENIHTSNNSECNIVSVPSDSPSDSSEYSQSYEQNEDILRSANSIIIFDPIEVLYNFFDKYFLIMANLDFIFNFTQNLGNYLFPHNIDENFHVFNLTSKKGYEDYILYKRPLCYIYRLWNENITDLPNLEQIINQPDNIQIFSNPESFTDIRKTGAYPNIIIIDKIESFVNIFSENLFEKLIDMITKKENTFFIIEMKRHEILSDSYFEKLKNKMSYCYFIIPQAVPFYEDIYYLCFIFESSASKIKTKTREILKRLEQAKKIRKIPNLRDFDPFYSLINWEIYLKNEI